MKHKLLLLAAVCGITGSSFATIHTITAGTGGGTSFSPSSGVTVQLGDTVRWVWATGSHTTTSTTIPGGANTWDQPLSSGSATFTYIPNVVGIYNYQCTPHASMGMTGSFTVVGTTGIDQVQKENTLLSIFPNPASGLVRMQFNDPGVPVSVALMDMTGKEVFRNTYNNVKETELSLKSLPGGIYIVSAAQGNNVYSTRLVIAR